MERAINMNKKDEVKLYNHVISEQNIYNAVIELLTNDDVYLKMSKASNPYGDGHASERIVNAIIKYFEN